MKKAISRSELNDKFSKEFITRYDTLNAEKTMLTTSLEINKQVKEANIHELFMFYDSTFFGSNCDGKIILEWSSKMTLCAGICYASQIDPYTG